MTPSEFNDFLHEKGPGRAGGVAPRVYLAAFGKHPGWNDHIDDLGFETQTLVVAKRFLYFEGISSQIDQGAWERLDPAHQHVVFDHTFIWQRGNEVLLGIMRDSTDGKGRRRYPMVLCLHAIGLGVRQVLAQLAPRLEQAMIACTAVATAEEVRAVLDRARAELREAATSPSSDPGEDIVSALPPKQPDFGADHEGLFRILYQLKNQFGDWAPGRVDFSDGSPLPRAAHLRAPQFLSPLEIGASWWLDMLRSQLDAEVPVLLLWSRSATWVDVIVGPPGGSDLFVLKANAQAVPLATEVPYQIDPAFREETAGLLGEFALGSTSTRTVFGARVAGRTKRQILLGVRAKRLTKWASAAWRSVTAWFRNKQKNLLLIVAGVVGSLLLGVAVLIFWATLPVTRDAGQPSPPSAARAAEIPASTLEAWRALCTANFEWLGRLQSELKTESRRTLWRSDPFLRREIIERLESVNAKLDGLSPQRLAGTSGSGISLANNPPPSLAKPQVEGKVVEAASVVAAITNALREWPLRLRMAEMEQEFSARGWTAAAKELMALGATVQTDATLAASVDQLLARRAELEALSDFAAKAKHGFVLLAAEPDSFLQAWAARADEEAKASGNLRELAEVLTRRTQRMDEVLALLTPGSGLQREQLAASPSLAFDGALDAVSQVSTWLTSARGFLPLPDSERPRPSALWPVELATLRGQADQLQLLGAGGLSVQFIDRIDTLSGRYEAWKKLPGLRRDEDRLKVQAAEMEAIRKEIADELSAELTRRANPAAWLVSVKAMTLEGGAAVSREWTQRRDVLLSGFDPVTATRDIGRFIELQQRMTRLEQFMRAVAASPEFSPVPPPPGWSAALAADWTVEAEKSRDWFLAAVLEKVSWKDDAPSLPWTEFVQRPLVQDVIADYRKTMGVEKEWGERLARLTRKLDEGGDWASFTADEREMFQSSLRLPKLGAAQVIAERFEVMRGLSIETSRVRLSETTADANWGVALAAWRALGRLNDWPATLEEWVLDDKRRLELSRRIDRQFGESPRGKELRAELVAAGVVRWRAFLGRAKTHEEFRAAFDSMPALGVGVGTLTGRDRYNEWLYRVKETPWRDLKKSELTARRTDLLRELGVFTAGKKSAAGQSWIREFDRVPMTEIPVELARVGPGSVGWKLVSSADPDVLSFRWSRAGQREHRLDFRLLKPVTGKPIYLSTTEVPAQLMIDWSEEVKLWPSLMKHLEGLIEDDASRVSSKDPRPLQLNRKDRKLELSRAWNRENPAEYYPDGSIPPAPTGESPVNYLSPKAGQTFAEALHCRLPTLPEWQAALRMDLTELSVANAPDNRRDKAWTRLIEHIQATPGRGAKWSPIQDIFQLPGALTVGLILEKPAVDYDDGVLWFHDVGQGGGGLFKNLVGNVAEFITDEEGGHFFVVGGSCLSGATVDVLQAYPVNTLDVRGFSDVGFRLAFSIDRLSPGQQLAQLVAAANYQ